MRALEYRASAHRKVFFALVATIEAVLAGRDPLAQTAYRTFGAFRPCSRYTRAVSWSGNISKSSNVEMVLLLMTYPYLMREISHKMVRESSV